MHGWIDECLRLVRGLTSACDWCGAGSDDAARLRYAHLPRRLPLLEVRPPCSFPLPFAFHAFARLRLRTPAKGAAFRSRASLLERRNMPPPLTRL
eukprot:1191019-Prorocentrum_minimum.AAC.2